MTDASLVMSSTRVGGSIDSLVRSWPAIVKAGGGGEVRRGRRLGWFYFSFFFFLSGRDRGSVGGGTVEGVVRLVNPILNHQGSQHSDILENHICAEGGGGARNTHTHTHTHAVYLIPSSHTHTHTHTHWKTLKASREGN